MVLYNSPRFNTYVARFPAHGRCWRWRNGDWRCYGQIKIGFLRSVAAAIWHYAGCKRSTTRQRWPHIGYMRMQTSSIATAARSNVLSTPTMKYDLLIAKKNRNFSQHTWCWWGDIGSSNGRELVSPSTVQCQSMEPCGSMATRLAFDCC